MKLPRRVGARRVWRACLGQGSRPLVLGACAAWAVGLPALAQAQQTGLPGARLTAVFPAGGQAGSSVQLGLTGADLDDTAALLFSHPGITATPKTAEPGLGQSGPQPVEGAFTVQIPADVRPGFYEVRAVGRYGVSNPRAFLVGAAPEINEVEPNNQRAQATAVAINSVVNGRSDGQADQDFFKFAARAGQRVVLEISGYRLDSPLDPTLVLSDARGRELKHNRDSLRRDALLDFVAPADDDYFVEVRDAVFAGGADYVYRLTISTAPYVDFVLPAAIPPGGSTEVTLFGRNLPGSELAAGVTIDGSPLEKLRTTSNGPPADPSGEAVWEALVEPDEASADLYDERFEWNGVPSNPVRAALTPAPIVVEQEPANNDPAQAPLVTLPCAYCGQFYPRGDQDWLQFDAKAGETWSIEVVSQRLGRLTDPALVILQVVPGKDGQSETKELQAVDDGVPNFGGRFLETASDDPLTLFQAPADGRYRIGIRDLYGTARNDPRNVYCLIVRRPQPDFRLVAVPHFSPAHPDPNQNQPTVWSPVLRGGGSEMIDVYVFRRDGFAGEVTIGAENLPPGVTAPPVVAGPDQRTVTLVLRADNGPPGQSLVRLTGRAQIGGAEAVRVARCATMQTPGVQNQVFSRSRLSRSIAVAVVPEPFDFTLDVDGPPVFEMSRAGTVHVPVKLARRGEFKGNVTLTAQGLPGNVQPKNLTIEANAAEAKFEIALQPNAPLGSYAFHLFGKGQVQYQRNPEAAQRAGARKEAVDKLAAAAVEAQQAMAAAKAAAEQALSAATAAANQAAEQQQSAAASAATTETARKTLTDQQRAAEDSLAKDPNNEGLKEAKRSADAGLAEATTRAQAAQEALRAAEKNSAEAAERAKQAAAAKATAEQQAAAAEAHAKALAAAQQEIAKAADEASKRSQPQPRNIGQATLPLQLTITAAPIGPETPPVLGTIRPGAKLEVPIKVHRRYGFADAVPVRVQIPGGVGGLQIAPVTIPAGQDQAQLAIDAAEGATPGEHRLTLQFVPKFNNQDLTVAQEATLIVEKKP